MSEAWRGPCFWNQSRTCLEAMPWPSSLDGITGLESSTRLKSAWALTHITVDPHDLVVLNWLVSVSFQASGKAWVFMWFPEESVCQKERSEHHTVGPTMTQGQHICIWFMGPNHFPMPVTTGITPRTWEQPGQNLEASSTHVCLQPRKRVTGDFRKVEGFNTT